MGRFGNVMLTAGATDLASTPHAGEVVRFYLTNTANTRMFNVAIPGARMKLVGGDSGRYEHEDVRRGGAARAVRAGRRRRPVRHPRQFPSSTGPRTTPTTSAPSSSATTRSTARSTPSSRRCAPSPSWPPNVHGSTPTAQRPTRQDARLRLAHAPPLRRPGRPAPSWTCPDAPRGDERPSRGPARCAA